jgi:hypothetical protein
MGGFENTSVLSRAQRSLSRANVHRFSGETPKRAPTKQEKRRLSLVEKTSADRRRPSMADMDSYCAELGLEIPQASQLFGVTRVQSSPPSPAVHRSVLLPITSPPHQRPKPQRARSLGLTEEELSSQVSLGCNTRSVIDCCGARSQQDVLLRVPGSAQELHVASQSPRREGPNNALQWHRRETRSRRVSLFQSEENMNGVKLEVEATQIRRGSLARRFVSGSGLDHYEGETIRPGTATNMPGNEGNLKQSPFGARRMSCMYAYRGPLMTKKEARAIALEAAQAKERREVALDGYMKRRPLTPLIVQAEGDGGYEAVMEMSTENAQGCYCTKS